MDWLLVVPVVFFFSLPPAVLGTWVGVLLLSIRTVRALHLFAFLSALMVGVALPDVKNSQSRNFEKDSIIDPRIGHVFVSPKTPLCAYSTRTYICKGGAG